MIHSQIDTGYLLAWLILGGLAGIGLIAAFISGLFWLHSRDRLMSYSGPIFVIGAAMFVVLGGIGTAVTFPPFSMQYHRYVPVSGIVQNVSSRFLSDGNGTSQKFTVEINGVVYGVNDSRASQLHKGSPVTILCEKTFQFNGTPGWDCNWGKFGLNK